MTLSSVPLIGRVTKPLKRPCAALSGHRFVIHAGPGTLTRSGNEYTLDSSPWSASRSAVVAAMAPSGSAAVARLRT